MVTKELNANAIWGQFYQRLVILEQELVKMKAASQGEPPAPPPLTLSSLRGVWAGVEFSQEQIAQSHIKAPDL
jgi:hypothetical protein